MPFNLKIGTLSVTIGADTSGLDGAERKVKKTTRSMERSFRGLGAVMGAVLSVEAVRRTVMLADRMNMLDARIKNVSRSAREFQVVRQGIRDIAKETGSSIESVGTLAQRLLIAGESVGATSEQIVAMTSNLNKLGTIGGASAQQMSNAMLQFGQAMSGGVMRAEEFNSIVENTPLIAKAIADGMGKSVGELRQMVIDGKLLSEDVFSSLEAQTAIINKRFAEMPLTISRAAGMISNSFAMAVQEIDNGFEITTDIADVMKDIADTLGEDVVPFVDDIVFGFKEMLMQLDAMTTETQTLADDTFDLARSWDIFKEGVSSVFNTLMNFPTIIRNATVLIASQFDQAIISIRRKFEIAWEHVSDFFVISLKAGITKAKTFFNEFVGTTQTMLADLFETVGADDLAESFRNSAQQMQDTNSELNAQFEELKQQRIEQFDEEIAKINERADVAIEASLITVDAMVSETEAVKKNVAERIKQLRKEAQARRDAAAGSKKASDQIKQIQNDDTKGKKQKATRDEEIIAESVGKVFGIEKEAAVVSATLSLHKAIAKTLGDTGIAGVGAIAGIVSTFANLVSAIQGLRAPGRQFGGIVSGGAMVPVAEAGPEIFTNTAGRQFMIPDRQGTVTPLNAASGGKGMTVNVVNNANVDVSTRQLSDTEIEIMIDEKTRQSQEEINASLASGRGETFEALRQGSSLTRNTL